MKYYTVTFKKSIKANSTQQMLFSWNGYAEDVEDAISQVTNDPTHPNDKTIISILEQGFDIGDWVVVAENKIIGDEPGQVVAYANDGYIVVEWAQFDFTVEFHWTELAKTDPPSEIEEEEVIRCPACKSDYTARNDGGYQCQRCGSWWGVQ